MVAAVGLAFRRLARDVTRQVRGLWPRSTRAIQEAVSGIELQNYRQEGAIGEEFVAVNEQSYAINVRRAFVLANIFPRLTRWLVGHGNRSISRTKPVAGADPIASWYLFSSPPSTFLVPGDQPVRFLEPVPGQAGRHRTSFRPIDAESSVVQTGDKKIDTLRGEIVF